MNCKIVVENIRKELENYVVKNELKSLVLGVSGGIDSALCCALAEPVCRKLGVHLIGISIPIETNKKDEIERAGYVGNAFCTWFEERNLTDVYNAVQHSVMIQENDIDVKNKIRKGNIKARLRMITLYDTAQANCGCVLSTDNYTELMLSYFTIHGDQGDLGPIQCLWKKEVYEVSNYLVKEFDKKKLIDKSKALKACVDAIPTDGLGITNSDVEQLGAKNYDEVDKVLIEHFKHRKYLNHPVVARHYNSYFKRHTPYNFPRELLFEGCVDKYKELFINSDER